MPARLRVCWLVPSFPDSIQDPTYPFLGREATELLATGRVELVVLTENGAASPGTEPTIRSLVRPQSTAQKLQLVAAGFRSDSNRQAIVRGLRSHYPKLWRSGRAIDLLQDFKPHLIHSHFAVPNGSCGVSIARAFDAPSVVSLRGVDVALDRDLRYGFRLDPTYNTELRHSLAHVSTCLVATERMRALAISAGSSESRTFVLPNSYVSRGDVADNEPSETEPTARQNVQRPIGARHIMLSVGHLIERKGFDRGIRALVHLPDDYHYVIVGEGRERENLSALATSLGVQERTHFVGSLAPQLVQAWMDAADCYWFLSRFEAFGNVVLEAYGRRMAIVATGEGIAPDLLAPDAAACLVSDADDPSELALAATSLGGVPAPASRVGRLLQFNPEQRSAKLLTHYERAIEHTRD